MRANARYILATLTVLFFGFVGYVQLAAALTWSLEDVLFDDGAFATGSFTYDATNDILHDYRITTTTGPELSGTTYSSSTSTAIASGDSFQIFLEGMRVLALLFAPQGLTDDGGSVDLSTMSLELDTTTLDKRFVTAGRVTSTQSVPDASVGLLLGTAFIVLASFRRKLKK